MKIVLHMGLAKTGTTSLQNALHQARDRLLGHRVLYPDGGAGHESHKLLTALTQPDERVHRELLAAFDRDAASMRRAAQKLWDAIRRDVERLRPRMLVLSSEYFFGDDGNEDFDRLAARLAELPGEVEPVVYFREPAALFGSLAQQGIKNGRPLAAPRGNWLAREVPKLEAALGRPIVACVADRDQLVDGDIVADFLARFVAPVVGPVEVPRVRLNASISAEAMSILDRFRRMRYPAPVERMPDFYSLRRIVARLEAEEGRPGEVRLRPEIAAAIQAAAVDLLWLRARYGLVFAGVDYAAIDGAPLGFDVAEASIEDLFQVDAARRGRLQAAALAEALAAWRNAERLPWLTRAVEGASGVLLGRGMRRA